MSKITALIPARGGSKGVPGKNIKKLHGFPLLAYSIEFLVLNAGKFFAFIDVSNQFFFHMKP